MTVLVTRLVGGGRLEEEEEEEQGEGDALFLPALAATVGDPPARVSRLVIMAASRMAVVTLLVAALAAGVCMLSLKQGLTSKLFEK
jgi:hypothetical protein